MRDRERTEAFVAEAAEAARALGVGADLFHVWEDLADFDLYPDGPTAGTEYRIVVPVGIDDGRLFPTTAIVRDREGSPSEAAVEPATLPAEVLAKVDRLREALEEVAARHFPAPPSMGPC